MSPPPWGAWLLSTAGVVLIVTQSVLFRPVRAAFARVSPWLGKLVTCPLCLAWWVGAAGSLAGVTLWPAMPWPVGVVLDGSAASAWCWTLHVVLARLGALEL